MKHNLGKFFFLFLLLRSAFLNHLNPLNNFHFKPFPSSSSPWQVLEHSSPGGGWREVAPLPTPLYAARGASVGGIFHVTGGYYGGAYTNQVRLKVTYLDHLKSR